MSDRLNGLARRTGVKLAHWLTEHPWVDKVLLYLAGGVVTVLLVLLMWVIGAVGYSVMVTVNEARARQTWALVVVGDGDPVEVSRWASWQGCDAARQDAVRQWYERRGVVPALRCQGVKSWFELLSPRSRSTTGPR